MATNQYLEDYIEATSGDSYRLASLNKHVLSLLPPKGKVLDFGAGSGHLVKSISNYSKVDSVTPVELSLQLSDFMDKRFSSDNAISKTLQTTRNIKENSLDCIYSLDVLEHIEDDVATLKELYRVLKPGGSLLFSVPAHQYLYTAFDKEIGHFRRYSPAQLRKVVSETDFMLQRSRFWNILGYIIVFITKHTPLKRPKSYGGKRTKMQTFINRCLTFWFRSVEHYILFPIGLTLIVVLKKPTS